MDYIKGILGFLNEYGIHIIGSWFASAIIIYTFLLKCSDDVRDGKLHDKTLIDYEGKTARRYILVLMILLLLIQIF